MIDSHTEGRATSAGAGIISPWITQRRNKAWYELAKNGAAHYKSLINELDRCGEKETGYKQNGAIHLHQNIEQLKKLKNIALKRQIGRASCRERGYRAAEDWRGKARVSTTQITR